MYCVEIHKGINQIIDLFYLLGFWYRKDDDTIKRRSLKLLSSIFYLLFPRLFPLSLIAGAISNSENKDQFIISILLAIVITVLSLKLFYIIWQREQILELLHRTGVHNVGDEEELSLVNGKLDIFMKFATIFFGLVCFNGISSSVVLPFLGSERKLFLNIWFPFDWENNELAYWGAFFFILIQVLLTIIAVLFSVIMWYLLMNCALKYELLGHQLRKINAIKTSEAIVYNISDAESRNSLQRELISKIKLYQDTNKLTNQLETFLANIFLVQIYTSYLCICFSIYCLAFKVGENIYEFVILVVVLLYSIFDIFMVMYFGNEIELSSDRLSVCLFESNWIDQPESFKKTIIRFGERLKQPHQVVVGKVYPLTLGTFRKILNGAYSMFNLLQKLAG